MKTVLKCMILDDDPLACKALERLCSRHEQLHLMGVCHHAEDAVTFLEKEQIDLLFLDVEMPEYSGIDFLNMAPYLPLVIFTTSKAEYAVQAFSYNALDYLVKPITMPGFNQAADKALKKIAEKKALDGLRKTSEANSKGVVPPTLSAQHIYVREDRRYVKLDCDSILYFENVGDYVRIKTTGASHIIHGTLKNISEKLPAQFLRVHRSYIVNLDRIKDIEESTMVISGTVIPISRTHKSALMGRLKVL